MQFKNYYEILNVSPNASLAIISVAYKTLAKIYHPDVAADDLDEAKEKFAEISEAYEILSDSIKKSEYDRKFFKNNGGDVSGAQTQNDAENKINGWEVVEEFYPWIEKERQKLNKLNANLAVLFQLYLVETKDFDNAQKHYIDLKNVYLELKFGTVKISQEFGEYLIFNNLNHVADVLEKQITILGSAKIEEIIRKTKQKFASEIYGVSIKDLNEWREYFTDFFCNYEFSTNKELNLEFYEHTHLLSDEFRLVVLIKQNKMGMFKPTISDTLITFDIDVLNCVITSSYKSSQYEDSYSSDEEATSTIENRLKMIC